MVHEFQYLSVIPEIRVEQICYGTDDFILIASDGLFDKTSSVECINFIKAKLKLQPYAKNDLKDIALQLANQDI